jgi:hypothetical protein
MTANVYSVRRIEGLKQSSRRVVVFLECEQDEDIDAAAAFEKLDENRERELRDRFDYWIDGFHHDKYFHGWKAPGYRECFVFKWKHKRKNHRFYAFLCHPKKPSNYRFQLCVLVSHATKSVWNTDSSELDGANKLRVNPDVISAIQNEFHNA